MAQMADEHSEARRIGEVIRQARVLQRRSQKEVASALGYHQSKVSRLEGGRGTDDIRMLREVSRVLAIPPHRLGLAATSDINHSEPETEDMHRRTVLAAGIAALAAPTLPSTAHQDLVQSLLPGTARVTAEPVPNLQSMRDQVAGVRRLFCTCDYTSWKARCPS